MKSTGVLTLAVILVIALAPAAFADSAGRIHAKITTVEGDVYQGLVRWDRNEASWFDILNGDKDERGSSSRQRYQRKHERVKFFGITIGERYRSEETGGGAQSSISFGHLKSLEPLGRDAVRLTLKSGEEVILRNGSSDIGTDIRGIVIEDPKQGEIEFDWRDIEKVEFSPAGPETASGFGERLYGTLTTRRGDTYTGWASWDADELFTGDVLDGRQQNRDRKIKFERIRSIERRSSGAAGITLADGKEVVLRGTNDVNESIRGIAIYDPGVGQISVDWDDFRRIDFAPAPRALAYDDFAGGRRLEGTVYTEDGEQYAGAIRWDDDEEYSWEILDGECRDASFDIELGMIAKIEPQGRRSAIVTTRDGRSFRLAGSNDVNDGNRGIFVETAKGDEIEISWDELDRVEFAR